MTSLIEKGQKVKKKKKEKKEERYCSLYAIHLTLLPSFKTNFIIFSLPNLIKLKIA